MATETVLDTSEGFLGVTNEAYRAEAMSMPVDKLTSRLLDRLADQTEAGRHLLALVTMAGDSLPDDTDNDKTSAALWAIRRLVRDSDNALCEFAGYFEALIVRAQEAAHG